MRSAADEMRRVAARLHDEFHVDAGLDEAISQRDDGGSADLTAARTAVGTRIRALQAASSELRQLLSTLADLGALAQFTPEGLRELCAQLNAAFAADPSAGLAEWIEKCCQAAAELRIEALEQLTSEPFGYPPGSILLRWRFRTAQLALAKRDWRLARPVLRAAAEGLPVAETLAPTPDVQAAVRILLARIAVHLGEDPSGDLEVAETLTASAADAALVRAWSARRAGRPGDAAAHLSKARSGGSPIAVIAELVRQARQTDGDAALSAARDRLAAVASIVDVTSQLDRLIEPAPPELWLAVAERAVTEQDHELAATALERAERAAGDQPALGAVVYERRAELLADADSDRALMVQAWLSAGDYRWQADQPDVAERHYRTALTFQPDSTQAALGAVASEAAQWLAKPGAESSRHLRELLAKLESLQTKLGVEPATSWSLINAAAICAELASRDEDSNASYMWRAMLMIGRALILNPKIADSWLRLADVLGTFGLLQTAALAARRAFSLDAAQPQRAELIRATLNVGDLEVGRELLQGDADRSDPWIKAVDGFLRWRLGSREEAIELLREATRQQPDMLWARGNLMRFYLLSGEKELAKREAWQMRTYIGDRRDPDSLDFLADCAIMTGDLAEAQRIGLQQLEWKSRSLDEAAGRSTLGTVKLLTGQAEGVDDLVRVVELARAPRQLDDWERISLPVLRAQAEELGVELADLTPVTEAIGRRRAVLKDRADPLVELADATADTSIQVANLARGVLSVLLREADNDRTGALAALDAGAPAAESVPEWPRLADRIRRDFVAHCLNRGDLDRAMAAEQARLADSVSGEQDSRLAEISELLSIAGRHEDAALALGAARNQAGDTPDLARTEGDLLWRRGLRADASKAWEGARAKGASRTDVRLAIAAAGTDKSAAARLLHEAIASSYIDTATDLHALLTEPDDIAAVTETLREAGSDSDTEPGALIAIQTLEALPGGLQLPENGLEVHLPPSWYVGHEDPVNDFPLLARYIPEARLRLPWTLPGVQARDDASLEPDGYRILVLGILAEQGQVSPRADYALADTVPLLSAAAQGRVTEQKVEGMIAVERPEGTDLQGLDALLLVPATELISQRIESLATMYGTALRQFWSHQSRR